MRYFQILRNKFVSYSVSFWALCMNTFVFFISFNMLLPELPEYIDSLGGEEYKWMILGLWTIAAAIARPFSGKIADNISRSSVMYFGVIISVFMSFLYPFFGTIIGFLSIRFFHGFSTGFQPTGATALIADVVPEGKRGEAMGIFGILVSLGFSVGQVLGSPIKLSFGMEGLFFSSALLGTISLLFILRIKENKKNPLFEKYSGWKEVSDKILPRWNEIIGAEVIHPTILMIVTAMVSGTYLFMVPEISTHLGMENKGLFYAVNFLFIVVTRILSGRFYDRFGPKPNLYLGMVIMFFSLLLTGFANNVTVYLFSSIFYGISTSIISPVLFAWTADLADPRFKGRGMSTIFIALEIGIFIGAVASQLFYDNKKENIHYVFVFEAIIVLLMLFYIFKIKDKKEML